MLSRSLTLASLAALSLLVPACSGRDDDGPASAMPPATAIPMGAVGAEGARFDMPTPPKARRPDGIERKITPDEDEPDIPLEPPPDPSADPLTPPSPFGAPPTAPSTTPTTDPTPIHPPPPPIKKPKGTTI